MLHGDRPASEAPPNIFDLHTISRERCELHLLTEVLGQTVTHTKTVGTKVYFFAHEHDP